MGRLIGCALMRVPSLVVALIASIWSCAPSFAATVNAVQGQVLISTGQGYRQVTGSTEVGAGAIVVANPGASAQIVFPDACAVTVQPGSVYTIAPQSPCATGSSGSNTTTYLIGGAVVAGGGIAAAVLLTHKGSSASP
jgi:hypothetical protein